MSQRGHKNDEPLIGVEIGTDFITMAQVQTDASGSQSLVTLRRAVDSDDTSALRQTLQQMVDSGKFSGRRAGISIANGDLEHCVVRMTEMPAAELASALKWQAAKNISGDIESYEIRSFDAGEVVDGDEALREMIILGASRSVVNHRAGLLKGAGLEAVAVESLPTALARWVESNQVSQETQEPQVVLHIGHGSTLVVVVDEGQPRIVRQINSGQLDLHKALIENLKLSADSANDVFQALHSKEAKAPSGVDIDEAQDIVQEAADKLAARLNRELTQCLRYFSVAFRASPPTTGWIVGAEHEGLPLHDAICETSAVQWKTIDSNINAMGSDPEAPTHGGAFAESVGLSAPVASDAPNASFLVAKKAARQARQEGESSNRTPRLVAATVGLLMGLGGLYLGQSALELQSRVDQLARKLESTEDLSSQIQMAAATQKKLESRVKVLDQLTPPISTNSVLAILGSVMPTDTGLTRLTLDASSIEPTPIPKPGARKRRTSAKSVEENSGPTEMKLQLVGLAPSEVDVAGLVRRLSDHPLFSQVNLGYSKPSAHGDDIFREFNIEASVSLMNSYLIKPIKGDVAHVD